EALRDVLVNSAGQRLGGVVLVTDGGNNHGSSPLEAALIAREQNVPLFIYGVGVTAPPDLEVLEVSTRNLAFVGERLEVRAKIRSVGLEEEHTVATLMADGEPVATAESRSGGDREHELVFHYVPSKAGEARLDVSVPLRDAEVGRDNNTSSTVVRITDEKFKVLLIEQEPRWDFRYLLDYLQR